MFLALKERYPRLSSVEVHHKRGAGHNELTRFRYDAILRFDGDEPVPSGDWVERRWGADSEAQKARARREADWHNAARFLSLLDD